MGSDSAYGEPFYKEEHKMREILFRGKRIDNGEWAEGCYVNHLTRMLCPSGDFLKEGDEKHYIVRSGFADWHMPRDLEFVEVIQETVGQYTGLKDKHGRKIFEGDLYTTCGNNVYEIRFVNGSFCGGIFDGDDYMFAPLGWASPDDDEDLYIDDGFFKIMEVIGNIHDQKEDV